MAPSIFPRSIVLHPLASVGIGDHCKRLKCGLKNPDQVKASRTAANPDSRNDSNCEVQNCAVGVLLGQVEGEVVTVFRSAELVVSKVADSVGSGDSVGQVEINESFFGIRLQQFKDVHPTDEPVGLYRVNAESLHHSTATMVDDEAKPGQLTVSTYDTHMLNSVRNLFPGACILLLGDSSVSESTRGVFRGFVDPCCENRQPCHQEIPITYESTAAELIVMSHIAQRGLDARTLAAHLLTSNIDKRQESVVDTFVADVADSSYRYHMRTTIRATKAYLQRLQLVKQYLIGVQSGACQEDKQIMTDIASMCALYANRPFLSESVLDADVEVGTEHAALIQDLKEEQAEALAFKLSVALSKMSLQMTRNPEFHSGNTAFRFFG